MTDREGLAGRSFRLFWGAATISLFGDAVTSLALPLTAAITLGAGALQMGLLTAFGLLPHLLLYLPAGVLVDRHRRQPVMIFADLGRALLIGSVPALALSGHLSIQALYLIAFAAGALQVLFRLAYSGRLQSLVASPLRPAANGRLSLSRSLSFLAGPGVAGLLVQVIGPPLALLTDAASFLASAGLVTGIRAHEPPPAGSPQSLWQGISEGVRFTFSHPILRPFYVVVSTMNFFNFIYWALAVLYMVRALHLPPVLIGIPPVLAGLGAIIGSLAAAPLARQAGIGRTMVAGEVMFTGGFLAVPLAFGPPLTATAIIGAGSIIVGIGLMLLDANASTMLQALIPGHLMGRVTAASDQLNWGVRPLGALAGGLLGQWLGLHPALWIGTLGALGAARCLVATRVRRFRLDDSCGPPDSR
ncbi:MAG: MFS transporter [Candidatus Dormibacter sp.]|uniref:MFS transporter n=1 Tax=Candidatus Dormibacter sp. TaxID=2973982 RepID=UPI000DB2D18A|nr:MAG: MFS transporter [Candidatus Dormibacteraeota bacterium]